MVNNYYENIVKKKHNYATLQFLIGINPHREVFKI